MAKTTYERVLSRVGEKEGVIERTRPLQPRLAIGSELGRASVITSGTHHFAHGRVPRTLRARSATVSPWMPSRAVPVIYHFQAPALHDSYRRKPRELSSNGLEERRIPEAHEDYTDYPALRRRSAVYLHDFAPRE